MTLPDYLRFVANRMESSYKENNFKEVARLCKLVVSTLSDKIGDFDKAPPPITLPPKEDL